MLIIKVAALFFIFDTTFNLVSEAVYRIANNAF